LQLHDLAVIDKEIHIRAVVLDIPREHIRVAPADISALIALLIVPPVEIMSSMTRHALPRTSPSTIVMAVASPFIRSFCNAATGQSS